MFRKLFFRLFWRRRYWRNIEFDQLAELYTSRLLTVFAINIINLFAAVYLYKLGYSLLFIALFYGVLYLFKVPLSYVAARIAAYFGPKHGIFYANLLRIPSLVAFAFVPEFGLWAVIVFGVFQQMSAVLYDLCYMVGFSKIKSTDRVGREIGNMQIIEKIARVLSPVVGGVVASVYSPTVTIVVACTVFAVAALPLFRSMEPTATKVRLKISGFPWRLTARTVVAETVVGFDFVTSGLVWTLFVTLIVFEKFGDGIYAALGALASLSVLASVVATWIFGQLVDRRKGGMLSTVGTIAKSVVHLFRPAIVTPAGVLGVNTSSETASSAYIMPFTRLVFDTADASGFRITYLMFVSMATNVGAALCALLLALFLWLFDEQFAMQALFIAAAFYQLLMLVARHNR